MRNFVAVALIIQLITVKGFAQDSGPVAVSPNIAQGFNIQPSTQIPIGPEFNQKPNLDSNFLCKADEKYVAANNPRGYDCIFIDSSGPSPAPSAAGPTVSNGGVGGNGSKPNGSQNNSAKSDSNKSESNAQSPTQEKSEQCQRDLQSLDTAIQSCANSVSSHTNDCQPESNLELKAAGAKIVGAGLGIAGSLTGGCAKAALAAQGLGVALGAFSNSCGSAVGECQSSCQSAQLRLNSARSSCGNSISSSEISAKNDEISQQQRTCQDFQKNVAGAKQGQQQAVQGLSLATHCTNLSASTSQAYCSTNPADPICYQASQPVTLALSGNLVPSQNTNSDSTIAGASLNSPGAGNETPSGIGFNQNQELNFDTNNKPNPGINSGGAGNAGSGSLPGTGGLQGAARNSAASRDAQILNGTRGSAQNYGGSGGAYNPNYQPTTSKLTDAQGRDLRLYLPGQKFDPRLRTPAALREARGIAGSEQDIFELISRRYESVRPSLLQN